ncbi:MAG: hypothetical protein HAW67_05185, partial [Endozoicomonadaceae bacterium]|nr:hypothetical protein [Endozoicomonadaceae bacterium]
YIIKKTCATGEWFYDPRLDEPQYPGDKGKWVEDAADAYHFRNRAECRPSLEKAKETDSSGSQIKMITSPYLKNTWVNPTIS